MSRAPRKLVWRTAILTFVNFRSRLYEFRDTHSRDVRQESRRVRRHQNVTETSLSCDSFIVACERLIR